MNREQAFLIILLALSAAVSLIILLPMLEFVLVAIVLAYVLHPAERWLRQYVGASISPFLVLFAGLLLFIVPFGYIAIVLYRDLQNLTVSNPELNVSLIESRIFELTGEDVNLLTTFRSTGRDTLSVLFGDLPGLVSTAFFITIGMIVAIFIAYYLLRDGEAFVAWLIELAPANDAVCEHLVTRINETTRGVVIGHLFVAFLQGALGGIAFLVLGFSNVVFWSFVMTLLALVPLIGTFIVWAPAASYLVLIDRTAAGIALIIWGSIVIGLSDNYIRPIVIDRDARLNPAVILIGVFGGIYSIGLMGLFIGPIILGVLATALQVFHEQWDRLGTLS